MASWNSPRGRRLHYRVSGPDGAMPLVFHHGTPGAETPIRALELGPALAARALRLVTTSRPGYGSSDRLPGRSVVDVADDTSALLAKLGADRCLIAGWSGGGLRMRSRAAARRAGPPRRCVIAPQWPPSKRRGWTGAPEWARRTSPNSTSPWKESRRFVAIPRRCSAGFTCEKRPRQGIRSAVLSTILPEVDRAVLTDEFAEDMEAGFHEALRTGVDGWLDDDLAFTKAWGFDLTEIAVPTLLWQGSADLMVPFAHGQWLGANVPGARAHLEDGEGHLSVGVGALERMLDELVATADIS